jgi:hypothetical protein
VNPIFAVVGHPNKGKSSIVATLTHDDSVAISAQSGTTEVSEKLTLSLGGASYTLIDTPGFQRPTRVLTWLELHAESAERRQSAVQKFVEDLECQQNFPDEVQLLTPIVNGAAILYVVDGSRPYGPEYETEMEILRWTGQPSMALINPIENESHIDSWARALGQYFMVVKVFNPLQADFDKQLAILEAFSHLKDEWQTPIEILISESRKNRADQQIKSIAMLANLLTDLCSYQVSQLVLSKHQAELLQSTMESRYFLSMKQTEAKAFDDLKRIYAYRHLDSEISDLSIGEDLFDTEKWIIWGLNRKQLALAATMAGAAAGAIVDAGFAGQSFLLGAIGGGLVAGGSAWFGADRLAEYKIKGLPIGGYEVRQGPIQNRNFPYVVLGRYLSVAQGLQDRNHARRDVLQIEEGELAAQLEKLTGSQNRALHTAFGRLSRQKSVENLEATLAPLFSKE